MDHIIFYDLSDQNIVITAPVDILAPSDAKSSTDTVFDQKLDRFTSAFRKVRHALSPMRLNGCVDN